MTTQMPPRDTATQLDRLTAVVLAVGYLGGLAWFLASDATDRIIAYYIGAGTLVILPTIVYLLSRVLAFSGIADKLDALRSTTAAIEKQTNGALTTRLDNQTAEIVARIIAEWKAENEASRNGGANPERAYTDAS